MFIFPFFLRKKGILRGWYNAVKFTLQYDANEGDSKGVIKKIRQLQKNGQRTEFIFLNFKNADFLSPIMTDSDFKKSGGDRIKAASKVKKFLPWVEKPLGIPPTPISTFPTNISLSFSSPHNLHKH